MKNNSFSNENNQQYAKACLAFAKKLGLVDDDSLDAVKKRCDAENEKRAIQQKTVRFFTVLPFLLPRLTCSMS